MCTKLDIYAFMYAVMAYNLTNITKNEQAHLTQINSILPLLIISAQILRKDM
jgi:hypothetical protein